MCPKYKKTWRRIAWFGLVLLALLVLLTVVLVGPWPAWGREGTPDEYRQSVGELEPTGDAPLVRAPLQAGRAWRSITPSSRLPLCGRRERGGERATGVATDLHVKALALSNGQGRVLLLSADMLLLPDRFVRPVRRELAHRTGWGEHEMVFSVTNTHSAPSVWTNPLAGRLLGGRGTRAYAKEVAKAFVQAGVEAVETIQPAFWGTFEAPADDLVRDRAGDAIDGTLRGFLVRHLDGTSTVVLNFGAAASMVPASSRLVSGDYPGHLQESLEAQSGVLAMFQAGAIAGCVPVPPEHGTTAQAAAPIEQEALALGNELARRARQSMARTVCREDIVLAAWARRCPLPRVSARLGTGWRLSPAVPWSLGMRNRATVQVVRLGSIVVAALPVEFSGRAYRQLTAGSQKLTSFWVSSPAGGYQGCASDRVGDGLVPWCGLRSASGIAALLVAVRDRVVSLPRVVGDE
jgi:hypothetical protein